MSLEFEFVEYIEAHYGTWGTHGQYKNQVAILMNGRLIDPRSVKTKRKERLILNIDGIQIIVEDHSSNKNVGRTVYIPKHMVLAVVEEIKTTGGWKGFRVTFGDGEILTNIVEDVKEFPPKRLTIRYREYYYVNKDMKVKVLLRREKDEIVKIEYVDKPRIFIGRALKMVIVWGDTFPVKELLKSYGFRFNSAARDWRAPESNIDYDKLIGALREVAEVVERWKEVV